MGKIRPPSSDEDELDEDFRKSSGKKSVSWAVDNEKSDEEVLAFDDDDDSMESDVEQEIDMNDDDDEDLSGAWGTSRKVFYNEDVNADDQDEKLEEQEATLIQKKYFEMLEKKDFGLDLFEEKYSKISKDETIDEATRQRHIVLPSNLLDLSSNERLQLLRDQTPEIEKFSVELKILFDDLKIYLLPFVELVVATSSVSEFENYSSWQFVLAVLELFLVYSSYLSLFLAMKSNDPNLSRHPIENELDRYEKLFLLIRDDFNSMKNDLLKLCEILQERKLQMKTNESSSKIAHLAVKTSLKDRMAKRRMEKISTTNEFDEPEKAKEEKTNVKRAITYQMQKNKGLTVRRKKEYRNPRVRHRNKYARALTKRTSRVPTARTENEKYAGEPTGIRAGIKRGIKLKT